VLDVATGEVTRIELAAGDNPRPLAWSPDGHQIAYVTTTPESGLGPLTIFDVVTGEDDPRAGNVSAVAFSPDGSRLAVQDPGYRTGPTTTQIMVIGSDPVVQTWIPITLGLRIAGSAAWSPDGRLIAMIQPDALPNGYGGTTRTTRALRFVAADGSPDSVPADIPLGPSASFQGWRGDSVVVWDGTHLTAIPVNGGPPTTLADTGAEVSAAQFASGLLSTATVIEPGPVDRGPWPRWARLALGIPVGVVIATLVGIGWWLARRRLWSRSAQLST
jgi:dipeptidyl aminopeptidase/acylaminoacyl peptidase